MSFFLQYHNFKSVLWATFVMIATFQGVGECSVESGPVHLATLQNLSENNNNSEIFKFRKRTCSSRNWNFIEPTLPISEKSCQPNAAVNLWYSLQSLLKIVSNIYSISSWVNQVSINLSLIISETHSSRQSNKRLSCLDTAQYLSGKALLSKHNLKWTNFQESYSEWLLMLSSIHSPWKNV